MDERDESGLTDYQLRFIIRELLAYAEQARTRTRLSSIWKNFFATTRRLNI